MALKNIMAGLTHTEDGDPIIRAPRTLKVGIGVPKGRAIRVFIHPSGEWYVMKGEMESGKLKERSHRFPGRSEAETFFHAEKDSAPVVGYPRKLSFFTFSRPVVTKEGGEAYEPDFDAIEAAGPVPTEIKVVFMSADCFEGAYQLWSATELKCRGNGLDAMRANSMEPTNPAAIAAKAAGQKTFPIINGCWIKGCRYANKECKPGATLNFQLAKSVRVGGTAFFHTTGFRSTKDIFSSLEEIKSIVMLATRRSIVGIPMSLKLRPYITKPEGQKAATQYAVRVELDSMEISKLQSRLLEQSFQAETLQIAGSVEAEAVEPDEDDPPMSAQAMADEFYPDQQNDEPPSAAPLPPAATATQAKQDDIGAKLKNRKADAPVPATDLTSVLPAEKARVGVAAFNAIVAKHHQGSPSSLKADSPGLAKILEELKAMESAPLADDSSDPF